METIAVYWEPKIRIYGLTRQAGLSLHTVLFPAGRLAYWGGRIRDLAAAAVGFELVNLQTVSAGTLQFCLLLAEADNEALVRRLLEKGLARRRRNLAADDCAGGADIPARPALSGSLRHRRGGPFSPAEGRYPGSGHGLFGDQRVYRDP